MSETLLTEARPASDSAFRAIDPSLGEPIEPPFPVADAAAVADACRRADAAFDLFRELDPDARASLLEAIATEIEALGDPLILRTMSESGLPRARLEGERARTTGQLRLFARLLRQGRWAGVTIDSAQPDRAPLPRADLRQRRIALGPVAVFGASNFPLAFSVAGGDTASALAAGCPVVVKGHPAHPGTSALVAKAIHAALDARGLPQGVFALLQGPGTDLGAALVADPHIKAVGFTGSRAGGLALLEIAQRRPEPIPVFAEMSSVNPVLLFPGALATRAAALGAAYVGSLTLGAGQFCTNPGLVLGIDGADLEQFATAAAEALAGTPSQTMLSGGIHAAYERGVTALSSHDAVEQLAQGVASEGCNRGRAALLRTDAASFLADPVLSHEVFGAASLIVRCRDMAELRTVIERIEGQLTITLQVDETDLPDAAALMPLLERKAGRILANGWPTGVEVSSAMVHGGPFPATSDSRTTSVGTAAIERFLRPVCYQDLPDALLPKPVKRDNPLALPRLIDGEPG